MKCFFLVLIVLMPLYVSAQQAVGASESKKMIEEVCAAAGGITSLQCDFRQVKQLSLLKTAMVSQGKMYYRGGRLLRWEYVSPYTYTFILNDDKAMLKSMGKTDVVSVKSSKLFQQIARIMMHSITGKCLSDSELFSVAMYTVNGKWMARLAPKQKELAQFFSFVQLYIDPKMQMVTTVELIEKGGDVTEITLNGVKKNVGIPDAVFTIQ